MSQEPPARGHARRTVLGSLGLAAAGAPLLLSSGLAEATEPTIQNVLWTADPARGTGVFDGLEQDPGRISVGDDPQGRLGRCFKYEIWDLSGSKERCESRGMRGTDGRPLRIGTGQEGRTFYFGWRSLWSPLPIASGRWTALYQLHVSGVSSPQVNVGPFVLRTLGDGRLHFQHISPNGDDRHIWSTSLQIGRWQSFAIGFLLSRTGSGWVEFWYDGVQQRFSNNQTRYPGPTLWGSHVNTKWGIYRSGPNNGRGTAYLNSARLGTSYADVAL